MPAGKPADQVKKLATDTGREFQKIQRAQPNMRTVQITEDYDVDIRDRLILVDTTAGNVNVFLKSATENQILPLGIIKTSSDTHHVIVHALGAELIAGPTGAFTSLDWNLTGVGYEFHQDGISNWWVEATTVTWSTVTSTPTTVAGYGITDAYTKAQVDAIALNARSTLSITTAALLDGATENGNLVMPRTSMWLILLQADRKCWVRFYGSAAAQGADALRLISVLGTAGTGLLGDFRFSGAGTIPVSPNAGLSNQEGPAQKRIFYTIVNQSGATHSVTATLTVVPYEP